MTIYFAFGVLSTVYRVSVVKIVRPDGPTPAFSCRRPVPWVLVLIYSHLGGGNSLLVCSMCPTWFLWILRSSEAAGSMWSSSLKSGTLSRRLSLDSPACSVPVGALTSPGSRRSPWWRRQLFASCIGTPVAGDVDWLGYFCSCLCRFMVAPMTWPPCTTWLTWIRHCRRPGDLIRSLAAFCSWCLICCRLTGTCTWMLLKC